jgi:hypothetical protein
VLRNRTSGERDANQPQARDQTEPSTPNATNTFNSGEAEQHTAHRPRFDVPVIDERTDRELRARYLAGEISIGVYLDWRFGTTFSSTGDRAVAG